MSTEGFVPTVVDQYGGLCTLIDRSDLPVGVSPDAQNVKFFPGGVRSRDGIQVYRPVTTRVNHVKSVVLNDGVPLRIFWLNDGSLYSETTQLGSLTAITSGYGAGTTINSTTAFGREWICVSDGNAPLARPMKWNGVGITSVTRSGPPEPGTVTVAANPLADATPGYHLLALSYETADGHLTPAARVKSALVPAGPTTYQVYFSTPVIAPAGCTLKAWATLADSAEFYTTSKLSATQILLESDDILAACERGDSLVSDIVLGPMLGVTSYHRRMVFWGERSELRPAFTLDGTSAANVGLADTDFDAQGNLFPSSVWTTVIAGGSVVTGVSGAPNSCYKIDGDSATVTRGQITQTATNKTSSFSIPIQYMRTGKKYGVRARVKKSGAFTSGGLRIEVFSGSGLTTQVALLSLTASQIGTDWAIYEGTTAAAIPDGTLVDEIKCVIFGSSSSGGSAIPTGSSVYLDWFALYDVFSAEGKSLVRISRPNEPEGFSGIDGFLVVGEANGQEVRSCFELRGNLYIAKERSLYAAEDNGYVPATWSISEVSSVVGTPSVNGVALGDGWAIIAGDSGVYMFSGGMPEKISQEIDPTWSRINWTYGYKIWVAVDPVAQRVLIGAPLDGASECNALFECDYVEGWGVGYSSGGSGRKWSLHTGSFPHGTMAVTENGSRRVLLSCSEAISVQNAVPNSEDYTVPSPWSLVSGTVTSAASISDPLGGTSAGRWTFVTAGTVRITVAGGAANDYVLGSLWVRSSTAVSATVSVSDGTLSTSKAVSVTQAWRRVSVLHYPAAAATTYVYLSVSAPAGAVLDVYGYALARSATPIYYAGYGKRPGGITGAAYGVMEFVSGEYYDSTGAVPSVYETAPIGMDLGRSLFDKAIVRVRGAKDLLLDLVRPGGARLSVSRTTLAPSPDNDIEVRSHQIDTQLGVRLSMTDLDGHWSTRRMGLMSRPSEHSTWRSR